MVMSERFAFEESFKLKSVKTDVELSSKQHQNIKDSLIDIASDLDKYADPTMSRDRVRFIPRPNEESETNKTANGVGTVIDLSVTSHRKYFEDNSDATFGLLANYMSGREPNKPVETISRSSIIGDLLAPIVNLDVHNNLMSTRSSMTFNELTQSLYSLTGIANIRELGNSDNQYEFKDAIYSLFKVLVSKNVAKNVAVTEITREKTYVNEDPSISIIHPSPVIYESSLAASLESSFHMYPEDKKNPKIQYIGLTCIGMVNLFDEGKIYQEFKYSFFRGIANIPTVNMRLKSEDVNKDRLASLIVGMSKNVDGTTITSSAMDLLSQLTNFAASK